MRKNSSFLFPTNNVPQLLPSTILWMLWKSFPLAMTMSAPAAVAMIAAVSLVAIPPVPTLLPVEDLPSLRILSSMFSTMSINCASGLELGSSVKRPSISDMRSEDPHRSVQQPQRKGYRCLRILPGSGIRRRIPSRSHLQ